MQRTLTILTTTRYVSQEHPVEHIIQLHRIEETGTFCLSMYRDRKFLKGMSFDSLNEPMRIGTKDYDYTTVLGEWGDEATFYGVSSDSAKVLGDKLMARLQAEFAAKNPGTSERGAALAVRSARYEAGLPPVYGEGPDA